MYYLFLAVFCSYFLYRAWKMRPIRLSEDDQQYLYENLPFYRFLFDEERLEFERRICYHLRYKIFESRGEFELTHNKKLMISAMPAMLTFGLDAFRLPHFTRFIVYPSQYYSSVTKQNHKGEVNLNGVIVLSWKDFEEGNAYPYEGINLGIHEFAHAVYFENLKDHEDYFFIDKPTLQYWYDMAYEEMEKMDREGYHYFREYAFTSKEEFFAVSAEYFFEQPFVFRDRLPEYYISMQNVFKQDLIEFYSRPENPLSENKKIKPQQIPARV